MGTSLTGLEIKDTYDGLVKTTDNAPLTGSLKVLTDGLGNDSALALSTGAASVTGTLAVSGNATFDTNTLFVDAAANEVGIGTATPSSPLDVVANNTTAIHLRLRGRASDSVGQMEFWNNAQDTRYGYIAADSTSVGVATTQAIPLTFATNTAERVRIDSSGNVGIGTSSPALGKLVVKDNGFQYIAETSNTATYGYLGIGHFANGAFIGTTAGTDPVSDIVRFGTGGVERLRVTANGLTFNGDTAAANALDDYEEGTWTPVIRGSGTAGTYEYTSTIAPSYTKIGRQVTVRAEIQMGSSVTGGGTGYAQITGLPFTNNGQAVGPVFFSGIDFNGNYVVTQFINSNATSTIYFSEVVDNGTATDFPISALGSFDAINFTLTYFV